jgi:hypothetical protein
VRFAVSSIAPNKEGPRISGSKFTPALASWTGSVRIGWLGNWDRDNSALTYDVVRDGNTASPVFHLTASSTFWRRPELGFVDSTNLEPGQTHRYQIFVTDAFGNAVAGDTAEITVSSRSRGAYADAVLADAPTTYWRLGEPSGPLAIDWARYNDGSLSGGVTWGADSAIVDGDDKAAAFNGSQNGLVAGRTPSEASNLFTLEAWIRTKTTAGGKIIGFGDRVPGESQAHDRHVYMDDTGRITFGVFNTRVHTVTSPEAYNDGKSHHVVASLGPGGMSLYVDGELVGQDTAATSGRVHIGFWRVGGDALGAAWPNRPSSQYFSGVIDEVAIYGSVLSLGQIRNHYLIGTAA